MAVKVPRMPNRTHFKLAGISYKRTYTEADALLKDLFLAASGSDTILYRGISRDNEQYPNIME